MFCFLHFVVYATDFLSVQVRGLLAQSYTEKYTETREYLLLIVIWN